MKKSYLVKASFLKETLLEKAKEKFDNFFRKFEIEKSWLGFIKTKHMQFTWLY